MKILYEILNHKQNRMDLIYKFQEYLRDGNEYSNNDKINEILDELEYDLEYYEPDEDYMKEDTSFYGDDKLEIMIKDALQKIEAILREE